MKACTTHLGLPRARRHAKAGHGNAGRHGKARQRGAILVELALVAPVLMLIVTGMLEIGMAWNDSLTVVQATRQGARVGSHFGDDMEADRQALLAVTSVLSPEELNRVEYIVIYDASGSGQVPDPCRTASRSYCNRYTSTELAPWRSAWPGTTH